MKGRREFLKDTATGALILGSQNEFGLVAMLELRAETEKAEEDRSHMEPKLAAQTPTTTLKMAQTPSLNIGYEQTGPDSGDAIVLLHGWPFDPRCYDNVRGPLATAGYRVIVPYLRCFGPTVFRSPDIFRSGQQSALGKDVIDLLDALRIEKATLVGYDLGGRAACVAAALWPERVHALASATGYTILNLERNAKEPGSIEVIRLSWYRWFLNMRLGEIELERDPEALARECWKAWSPKWQFTDAEFAATAQSFHNPDWIATTLNCYRIWYGNAPGDPALQKYEDQLAKKPKISVPTMILHGDSDALYPTAASEGQESLFTSFYERRILEGVGHCPPKEGPRPFVKGIEDLMAAAKQV
jgi:pimeloyl-ACP methyl ester carboxylesterase